MLCGRSTPDWLYADEMARRVSKETRSHVRGCACARLCIRSSVDVEWDPNKAHQNLLRHGIDLADACKALEDELALTIVDQH